MIDATDRANRASLVKQIAREQGRVDYWRTVVGEHPEYAGVLADAQAAIVKYTGLLEDGGRDE